MIHTWFILSLLACRSSKGTHAFMQNNNIIILVLNMYTHIGRTSPVVDVILGSQHYHSDHVLPDNSTARSQPCY